GGQPHTYLQPPLGADSDGISNVDPTPLFPFGYGTSYTSFELGEFRISDTEVPTDGEFTVSVRVRNTGPRAGDEVVQLYLPDVLADRTAFAGRDLKRIVEPGDIEVFAGTSARDLPCSGTVRLTGPLREAGHDRRLHTPVDVRPVGGRD